jgi:hypothetical protein
MPSFWYTLRRWNSIVFGLTVTFTTEFNPEGIAELRERLDRIQAALTVASDAGGSAAPITQATPFTPSVSDLDVTAELDRAMQELRRSTNASSQALFAQMMSGYEGEFTMPDVARDMKVDESTTQARFRNLCKPLNRLRATYPSLPDFWEAEQRDGRFHFKADSIWRQAVQRSWS